MRENGCVNSARDLGVNGHACWAFDAADDYWGEATRFLEGGLANGQRLATVAAAPASRQLELLEPIGDVERMVADGQLQAFELTDLYAVGSPIIAPKQLAMYAAATRQAMDDGFTGLRVAAEITELVRDPATQSAHLHWEAMADRYMASNPLSALCGFARGAVTEGFVHQLAAVHPVSNHRADGGYRLFSDNGTLRLGGEFDTFSASALDELLSHGLDRDGDLVLDVGGVGFIDHNAALVLQRHADRLRAEDRRLTIRSADEYLRQLQQLIPLSLPLNFE